MTDHPIARLLLYTIHTSSSSSHAPLPNLTLHLSSVHDITRPSSRPAEFFTGLVADREQGIVVGSLYTGVLTVVEVRIGKESGGMGKGKRKQGMGMGKVEEEELGELGFGEVYEIK
jgi:tetrahydromethanopterin S-methyltransferase subunit F